MALFVIILSVNGNKPVNALESNKEVANSLLPYLMLFYPSKVIL